ncbi:ependymin [Cololabis saira]|uniref:ependymin n=1 Tax=Cololabis saira TaxID=129043 RepID=UPI002AD54984|nr:ependymin [Cololabis saira]
MYAAVVLVVFACLTDTIHADHHQPCHPPNMTGVMTVITMKGEIKAVGAFTYDSMGKKLRFRSNDSHPTNTSVGLDLLMFFEQGVFYEIDSKNQTCEKKKLDMDLNPLDIPDDAKFHSTITAGSRSIEGEGLKVNIWTGSIPNMKGYYSVSVTMGCLPVSVLYFSESAPMLFSNMEVDLEIKDPDLLLVPSFCLGQPLEESPEGTVNSFIHEFM